MKWREASEDTSLPRVEDEMIGNRAFHEWLSWDFLERFGEFPKGTDDLAACELCEYWRSLPEKERVRFLTEFLFRGRLYSLDGTDSHI